MNKKRILIILIVTILLLIVLCLIIHNTFSNKIAISSENILYNNLTNTDENINNIMENETIIDNKISNNVSSDKNTNSTVNTTTQKSVSSSSTKNTTTSKSKTSSNKNTSNNKSTTNSNSNSSNNGSTNSNNTEKKPTDTKTNDETIVEVYKVNNAMINKMKTVINNNPSEDMKEFGYNIVVDSSIVNLTNQFTFSEKRLISKLENNFGTIRIYARDLYVNNGFAHTECFIF